jgi:DNA-binding response OmpR family regulator
MQPDRRLLVADDDNALRELIRSMLAPQGYDIHFARNGAEALDLVQALSPDGMILDINMPEVDGFGVLQALRGRLRRRLPVLMLTARHAGEDVRRAVSLGAKDYLAKPFNRDQLLARVSRLMRPPPSVEIVELI